ncbi:YhgE/Pip family protein [Pediococcus ethanolidurans]|nr:YhgE/Pip family protein [Pediococcus ethanolidurans]MCV3321998.1 YhgE/Pip family protein [Pediococcus ethanolidurans]
MIFKNWNPQTKRWSFLILALLVPILLTGLIFRYINSSQKAHTTNTNVAVVNNDKSAKFQNTDVSAGKQVIQNLSHNDQVKWHFVSAAKAKRELKNGHYLMTITIPKNFSQNITTALDKTPKTSNLKIKLSKHNSYVSQVINEQVASQVKNEVVSSVQKSYDKTLLSSINKLGTGIKSGSNGVKKLKNGVV